MSILQVKSVPETDLPSPEEVDRAHYDGENGVLVLAAKGVEYYVSGSQTGELSKKYKAKNASIYWPEVC